jgi:gephyrin
MRFILECLGYICAEEVVAKEPFPPFRASVKDGYAVRLHSDRSHEQIYEIVGRSDAGGESVRIVLRRRLWIMALV